MRETSVIVKDLCVDYRPLKNISIVKNLLHNRIKQDKAYRAVNHVSFEVKKGEILGIIGENGSGKSTLLKTIAGIFRPDEGTVDLKGNSISLMSIGVGFNDQISGRENIILSGMLLGFSEKEVLVKLKEIIDFAELGDFVDMPVRTYSSGMYSKLAFAITVNLETDILLIDEVLSVGDEKFRKKSLSKMESLIADKDRTVLIVSHDLGTLQEISDRILWLHDGKVRQIGNTECVLEEYRKFMV